MCTRAEGAEVEFSVAGGGGAVGIGMESDGNAVRGGVDGSGTIIKGTRFAQTEHDETMRLHLST